MTKRLITAAVGASLILVAYVAESHDRRNGGQRATARLDGYQENPSISTTGRGQLDLWIDEKAETIDYRLRYSRLEGAAQVAHIHFARSRVNGPVVVFLCGGAGTPVCPPAGGTVEGTIGPGDVPTTGAAAVNGLDTFAELVRAIRASATYADVHSTRWGGGEIRGQIFVTHGDDED